MKKALMKKLIMQAKIKKKGEEFHLETPFLR
jgi:hypothetical protein